MKDCQWETPLGKVEVDSESAEEISQLSQTIESDYFSHTREHSLEVQIPILQMTFSNFKILPISLVNQSKEVAQDVGLAIAKTMNLPMSKIWL
jgi:AmmeMemoRadiSam system protein B